MSALEKHYSPKEVGALWGLSTKTVQRMFEDMPGVLKIAAPCVNPRHSRRRKPRTFLRIPESLLSRAHEDRSRGFGREVKSRGRGV